MTDGNKLGPRISERKLGWRGWRVILGSTVKVEMKADFMKLVNEANLETSFEMFLPTIKRMTFLKLVTRSYLSNFH